jgi:hypothetical protein
MSHAVGVDGDAAKLVRFGEYAMDGRIDILIKVLEAFSAFVLAVTMYGITRDEDHELAMLALVCRVAEGVLGTLSIPSYLGLVWLAKAGVGPGAPDTSTTNALRTFLLMPAPSVPLGAIFFAVGGYDLLLSPPARTDGARLNRMDGRVRIGPARGGTAPATRRFPHRAADRIVPVAAGARIPGCARAVAAHQRFRHTGD